MSYRYAIYYAPAADDPLWTQAANWLGRDPAGGVAPTTQIPGVARQELDRISTSARRYGFHATLKAPMALADEATRAALETALAGFAAAAAPVAIGRLQLASIDGFIALVPVRQSAALTDFAGKVVAAFDRFRAPMSTEERTKRIAPGRLDARQIALLDQFGYPYVLEQFQFHMTLTDRLSDADRQAAMAAAGAWFAPSLGRDLQVDRLTLFHEPQPGAPFDRVADFLLSGKEGP